MLTLHALALDTTTVPVGSHWILVVFDRYGLPMLLLVGVAWAALRAARWIAPRFDKLIDRHQQFLDVLELELQKHGNVLERQGDVLGKVEETLSRVQTTQVRVLDILEESQRAASRAADAAAAAAEAAAQRRT